MQSGLGPLCTDRLWVLLDLSPIARTMDDPMLTPRLCLPANGTMRRIVAVLWVTFAGTAFPAALLALDSSDRLPASALSASGFTVLIETEESYRQPAPVLTAKQLEAFTEGSKGFLQRWVVAPSILGLWGRGPTSNGEACTDCHDNGGRGRAPSGPEESLQSMLVRLSIPGSGLYGAPRPDPNYGDQLQEEGILGRVPPEGHAAIHWSEFTVALDDGEIVRLRRPRIELRELAFGPLAPGIMTSARVAPPLVGVGLLDAVSDEAILASAAQSRARGLRGRPNRVWDLINERQAIGRFGHKANVPNLLQQIVTAYHEDLGVTSFWFPEENCPHIQTACAAEPPGGHFELPSPFLDPVLLYARALAVPARRNAGDTKVQRGAALFSSSGCDGCHMSTLETGDYTPLPAASHQIIHPYTDLLLHDMGEDLADGRPDYLAGPRDWRTAPLWGLGLSATVNGNSMLLHDGRARDATEAILWHGGEAQDAREAFRRMPKEDREALVAFLQSL